MSFGSNVGTLWAMDVDEGRLERGRARYVKAGVSNVQRHLIDGGGQKDKWLKRRVNQNSYLLPLKRLVLTSQTCMPWPIVPGCDRNARWIESWSTPLAAASDHGAANPMLAGQDGPPRSPWLNSDQDRPPSSRGLLGSSSLAVDWSTPLVRCCRRKTKDRWRPFSRVPRAANVGSSAHQARISLARWTTGAS